MSVTLTSINDANSLGVANSATLIFFCDWTWSCISWSWIALWASLFSFLFFTEDFFPEPWSLASVSLTLFWASSGEISTVLVGDFLNLLKLLGSIFFFIIRLRFFLASSVLESFFTVGLSNFDKSIFWPVVVRPLSLVDFALISSSFFSSSLFLVVSVSYTHLRAHET